MFSRRVPRWTVVLVGLVVVGVGVAITFKPFSSLGVLIALVAIAFAATAIAELVCGQTTRARVIAVA